MPWFRRRKVRDGMFAVLGIAALGVAAFVYFRSTERAYRVNLTAGSLKGLRHQMALTLAREAKSRGVSVRVEPTAGSVEALERVDAGLLDMALVQGGLDMARYRHVCQVAPLYLEPLHLLVKEELFPEVSLHLAQLRGKSVNLSERGSGTHALASEVLEFVGLRPGTEEVSGDFVASTRSYAELARETDRKELPDAVFMVSLLPAPVAKQLVAKHHYRVVELPFAAAFTLDALAIDDSGRVDQGPDLVDRSHVYDTTIPAFTYSVEPAVPPQPIHTLGTRLLLVANTKVDPGAVQALLEAAFTTRFSQLAHQPLDPKLLELPPEMPLHDGTAAYLARNKPVIADDVIDLFEKEVSIAGGILGGSFFLWQWLRRRYRRRREVGFEQYLLRINAIERQAQELEFAAVLDLKKLLHLQLELADLKAEALERFAQGELGSQELISGFLAHVSDARNHLTRMVLHVRESLEERALAEGTPAKALWQAAMSGTPATPGTERTPRATV